MANADVTAVPVLDAADWDSLKSKCNFPSRDLVLELAVRLSLPVRGEVMEFGVFEGDSTRTIRRVLNRYTPGFFGPRIPKKKVYACDSFEGLPEKYEKLPAGHFACEPPDIPGVEIVKGYFEDSLTEELARKVQRVSFAHLDADLYSSTMCALNWLTPLLHTGSVLLFDEFIGENRAEQRAFEDWSRQRGVRTLTMGEFLRPPSGHGDKIDKRMLYQVVCDEDIALDPINVYWPPFSFKKLGRRAVNKVRKLLGMH